MRVTMPALIVFVLTQLAATLLHLDILDWSHPTAWAWLGVYIASPLGAIPVALMQERRWRRTAPDSRASKSSRRPAFVVLAVISGAVGIALFLTPDQTGALWPWSLTPLTGRIVGGWVLSSAFLYWMLAIEAVPARARIGLTSAVAVMVLLLAGVALHREALDGSAGATIIYLAYTVAAGAIAGIALSKNVRGARGEWLSRAV